MKRLVISSVALALLTGCVKEERGSCPCYLTLDMDAVIKKGEYADAVASFNPCFDGKADRNLLALGEFDESGYEKKVKKDIVSVSVVCGQENSVFGEDCIRIALNSQADPIMAFAERMLCDSERRTAYVTLHKQYCRILLIPVGIKAGEECPFRSRVVAECNGMNLYDLSPVEGVFIAESVNEKGGVQSLLIPRQKKSTLRLDILDANGEVVNVIDLGTAFSKISYDWGKEDLDDISISIDYANAKIEIGIVPWETIHETVNI